MLFWIIPIVWYVHYIILLCINYVEYVSIITLQLTTRLNYIPPTRMQILFQTYHSSANPELVAKKLAALGGDTSICDLPQVKLLRNAVQKATSERTHSITHFDICIYIMVELSFAIFTFRLGCIDIVRYVQVFHKLCFIAIYVDLAYYGLHEWFLLFLTNSFFSGLPILNSILPICSGFTLVSAVYANALLAFLIITYAFTIFHMRHHIGRTFNNPILNAVCSMWYV